MDLTLQLQIQLHDNIRDGNFNAVKDLVENQHVDINARSKYFDNSIFTAISSPHENILIYLLNHSLNKYAQYKISKNTQSPLYYASIVCFDDIRYFMILDILLHYDVEKKYDVNEEFPYPNSPNSILGNILSNIQIMILSNNPISAKKKSFLKKLTFFHTLDNINYKEISLWDLMREVINKLISRGADVNHPSVSMHQILLTEIMKFQEATLTTDVFFKAVADTMGVEFPGFVIDMVASELYGGSLHRSQSLYQKKKKMN